LYFLLRSGGNISPVDKYATGHWFFQADQVFKQSTLATATATQNNKYFTGPNIKANIPQDDLFAKTSHQITHLNNGPGFISKNCH